MIRSGFVLLFTVSILFVFSCGEASKPANVNVAVNVGNKVPATSPLPAATIDELASGRKLYAANCANCHKENGTGGEVVIEGRKMKADDLTVEKRKAFPDEKIIQVMIEGIEDEGMPSFKDKLSEAEMRDVVKFIRVEIQKMPASPAPKS